MNNSINILLKYHKKENMNKYKNPTSFFKTYTQIILLLLIICLCTSQPQTCTIDLNCFQGCSDSNCIYDSATNSFYNLSLAKTPQNYRGPQCCDGCNSGYFMWMDMKTCSQVCTSQKGVMTYGNPLTRTCDFVCLQPYFGDNLTTKCVIACPNGSWASYSLNQCVFYCPNVALYHYTPNNTCMQVCPLGNFTYLGPGSRKMCGPQCPQGLFADNDTDSCVKKCPIYRNLQTYGHKQTKKCQSTCFGYYPYGQISQSMCVSVCPYDYVQKKQKYGDNSSSTCVYQCLYKSFRHDQIKICVSQCFGDFNQTNYQNNTCQVYVQPERQKLQEQQGSSEVNIIIAAASSVAAVILVILSFVFYKFHLKKRLIRKPWKYDTMNDIQFSL